MTIVSLDAYVKHKWSSRNEYRLRSQTEFKQGPTYVKVTVPYGDGERETYANIAWLSQSWDEYEKERASILAWREKNRREDKERLEYYNTVIEPKRELLKTLLEQKTGKRISWDALKNLSEEHYDVLIAALQPVLA